VSVEPSPGPTARRASYREGAGFGALSFISMGVLGLVSSVAIARVYGVQAIGEYALVMAPTNAVWYLSSARERPAFVRELAMLEPRSPRITALFWAMLAFSAALTLAVSLIAAVIIYFVYRGPIGRPELFAPALAYLATYLVVLNTAWNVDAVFLGFRAGRELFWIRLHLSLAFLAVAVACGIISDSVWGLVIANLASALTSLAHRLVTVRRYMRGTVSRHELRNGFRTLPDLIRFGLKVVPGSIATGVMNEIGTWALAVTGAISGVGAYNRAQTLARRLGEIDYRITGMLLPTMLERHVRGDQGGFDRALVDTVRYVAVFMLLPAAVGGGAADGVMAIFGAGFSPAANALALLLLMPALVSTMNVQSTTLLAVDRPWLTSAVGVGTMLISAGATVLLTVGMGMTGAALGLVVGGVVGVAWTTWVTRVHLSAGWSRLWPRRELLALAVAFVAGFAIARLIDSSIGGIAGLVPALIAGAAAYGGVFVLAGGVNRRDRERLSALLAAVRRRPRAPAEAGSSYVS
jgi:O-antigen/teichoic acid export membrane protein